MNNDDIRIMREVVSSMPDKSGNEIHSAIEKALSARTYHDPTCQFCRANHGEMYPPHDASQNCESGKRAHCSCDVCF